MEASEKYSTRTSIVDWVWDLMEKGELVEAVDLRLDEELNWRRYRECYSALKPCQEANCEES